MNAPHPPSLCLSLLRPTRGHPYSAKAVKDLWAGVKAPALLPFARAEFVTFRRQSAGRISISGVRGT